MEIDNRKLIILYKVIDEYIKTGEPVGSNTVLSLLDVTISSATVRNDMAFLEKQGYLEQPHISAGRVPTHKGYRLYIERLMKPKPLSQDEKNLIDSMLFKNSVTAQAVVDNACDVLAELTNLTVISQNKMPVFSVITRVEVIPAGRRLYALLIITSSGNIKNKVCRLEFDISNEQLGFFVELINKNLTGLNIDTLNSATLENIAVALGSYIMCLTPLLKAVLELSEEISHSDVHVKGENNILWANGIATREVYDLISHKSILTNLLSDALDGVSIIFGEENNTFSVTNSSLILSQYKMNDMAVGSLGLIGPVRIDYEKIIPYVEYFSSSITRILNEKLEDIDL